MTDLTVINTNTGELVDYEPKKELVKNAANEAAFKFYKKAKDYTKAMEALEKAAWGKHEFIAWWDVQEKNKGGGDVRNTPPRSGRGVPKLADFGMDYKTVSRWRSRFGSVEDTEKWIAEGEGRLQKLLDLATSANFSSDSVEWYTPKEYIDTTHEVMPVIDLDPASSEKANETVQAKTFYSDDSLQKEWYGHVFMNPPYGKDGGDSVAGKFCNKLIDEYEAGNVEEAIILVNSSHSQLWQKSLYNYVICFVNHRVQFVSGDGEKNESPTFQNIFVYMGKDKQKFAKAFQKHGYIMERLFIGRP